MTIKHYIITGIILGTILAAFPAVSYAAGEAVNCGSGAYGGTSGCPAQHKVKPDLLIQNPQSKIYEQSVSCGTPYQPTEQVNTKVNIQNTNTAAATNVTVLFIYPQGFTYAGGPGTYNEAIRTVTLVIPEMKAGEVRTFYYSARLVNPSDMQNKPVLDGNNEFRVRVNLNGKINEDAAQFCVAYPTSGNTGTNGANGTSGTKGGQNYTSGGTQIYNVPTAGQTPSTGPEMLAIIPLLPAAVSGYLLRRKTAISK